MTLTTNGKNWLAINAGINKCFVHEGIAFKDSFGISRTGGTSDIVSAFFTSHMSNTDNIPIIANTNYIQFKTINDNNDLTLLDVSWVYRNDGFANAAYCITSITSCGIPTSEFIVT